MKRVYVCILNTFLRIFKKAHNLQINNSKPIDVSPSITEVITTSLFLLSSLLLPDLVSAVPAKHAGLPSMPPSPPRLLPSPSPAPKCYTLSITGQHQSTPGGYTPDYCRYRFLNRKIYTLNIAVNTGKSIGMSELLLLEGLKAPSRRTVYTCSLNAAGNLACFNGNGSK